MLNYKRKSHSDNLSSPEWDILSTTMYSIMKGIYESGSMLKQEESCGFLFCIFVVWHHILVNWEP